MLIFIIKILVSIAIVLLLAEISKRINPTLGGIISGLPLGTALSVYFISYQMGETYLIDVIPWGICGLISSILLCFIYLILDFCLKINNKYFSIIVSSIFSFAVFLISGYFFYAVKLNIRLSLLIFSVFFILNIVALNRIVKVKHEKKKDKTTLFNNFIRALIVSLIIISITGLAKHIGNKWSVILSSFPSTLFPLILILHYEDRNNLYHLVIKGFSLGVSTLVLFYLCCFILIPEYGLNTGFAITYLISIVYLYLVNKGRNIVHKFHSSLDE
ncbi:MAG: hypothetical protein KA015_01180 [Spirochaetes bacterium]|nr:hypothetical protein [Spirochaetota bacterium]